MSPTSSHAQSDQRREAPIATTGDSDDVSATFGSNEVRLSPRWWMVVALAVILFIVGVPRWWKHAVPFDVPPDYRVPYALSSDYWTYDRWVEHAVARDELVFVLGDSVVWGEYVAPADSLSQCLSAEAPSFHFANGGLNGTHPLALEGLVRDYAGALHGQRVILHCNLLWMSSMERDLQVKEETAFNHPGLVPQFRPGIPCYKANANERLGIIVDRLFSLRQWVKHLRIAYFDGQDLQNWSIEHPYDNPLPHIRVEIDLPRDKPHSPPISWTTRGIPRQDIPWVKLESSLQWNAFTRLIDLLRGGDNRLFVIVGPFNEHMLTDESRLRYQQRKTFACSWLRDHEVPFHAPAPLPAELYGDASHPIAEGYRKLAHDLNESPAFRRWLNE